MKTFAVSTETDQNGFAVLLNKQKFRHIYPVNIWKSYPAKLKAALAETTAFFFTHHLPLVRKIKLDYQFPPPSAYSLYMHGVIYSLLENSPYIKSNIGALNKVIDSSFNVSFKGIPSSLTHEKLIQSNPKVAVLLFTFGKDSLLTYALSGELKLAAELVFYDEPYSPYERLARQSLIKEFREHSNQIHIIDLELGKLRQNGKEMWGWDLLITGYLLLLLPYVHFFRAKYFFISNEMNHNFQEKNKDGFMTYSSFEQSSLWTINMNHLLRFFNSDAISTSLIESLSEYLTTYILYHRYPQLAKYHLSCCGDEPLSVKKRWCGKCFACARIYIFLLSFGIKPQAAGIVEDLLQRSKAEYFGIFSSAESANWPHFLNKNLDTLLAFYLAYLRGVNGELIELFKKKYLNKMAKEKKLFLKMIGLHKQYSVPDEFKDKLKIIFLEEIKWLKNDIKALFYK